MDRKEVLHLYGGLVWVVQLDDGGVAGVERQLDPDQWLYTVGVRGALPLHRVPETARTKEGTR
jgi:hypothetical protein